MCCSVALSVCVWVGGVSCFQCVCLCVRCVLAAVSYSGSRGVPGVSVWLSPPAWAPSAGPGGHLSPGLFAGSWSSAGLRAHPPQIGVEGEDWGSSQGAWAGPGWGPSFKTSLRGGDTSELFVCKTNDAYSVAIGADECMHMLIITCSIEGHVRTHALQFFIVY